jgi:glycosyltransferase involved in cell wall biosynthesis
MTAAQEKKLRIGFDVSQTAPGAAGCGQMADALVRTLVDLYPEDTFILYPVFGTLYFDPHEARRIKPIERPHVLYRLAEFRAADIQVFWQNPPPNAWSLLGCPDVVHANNFFCPTLREIRVVYTLHDVAFLDHPEYTTSENAVVSSHGVDTASKFADMIVAVSEFSRKRFLEVYTGFPEERIRVLHLGSRFETAAEDEPVKGLQKDGFWLSVGTLEPRKNLRNLLKAYAAHVRSSEEVVPLALAGGRGWLEEGLERFIDELGLRNSVHLLGYVADAQLRWLYRNCRAFCFPSRYEGFGLPVLEAMSMGAAVMTSDVTSLPEIGGDAVLYVNPFDVDDITRGFNELAGNAALRDSLRSKGVLRANEFSWRQTARKMRELYAECVELPKRDRTIFAVKAGDKECHSSNTIDPAQVVGADFPKASIRKRLEVAVYLFVKRRKGLKEWIRRLPLVSRLLASYHKTTRPQGD